MPEVNEDSVWGVIFLANLAPAEVLSPENREKEWLKKQQEFNRLMNDVLVLNRYTRVKPAFIVNEIKPDREYCEAALYAMDRDASGNWIKKEIRRTSNFNIGDPAHLSPFFQEACHFLQAQKYVLFTWDHGFGTGMFASKIGSSREIIAATAGNMSAGFLSHIKPRMPSILKGNFSVETISTERLNNMLNFPDKAFPDVLTMNELVTAISNAGFPGNKVEVLAMMNCSMMLVDTAYALRQSCNYLVAAQSPIWWFGYEYKSIIQQLQQKPGISSRDLAVFILLSERKKMQQERARINGDYQSSLSVVDCSVMDDFADRMEVFSNYLRREFNDTIFEAIYAARIKLRSVSCLSTEVIDYYRSADANPTLNLVNDCAPDYAYIDLFSFLEHLAQSLPLPIVEESAIRQLIALKQQLVVAISPPLNIYAKAMEGLKAQFGCSGVSLFLPRSQMQMKLSNDLRFIKLTFYFINKLQTRLNKKTKWSNVITLYCLATEQKGLQ